MDITILMTTWLPDGKEGRLRAQLMEYALKSWRRNLIADREIWLHVADDGTSPEMKKILTKIVKSVWSGNISWSGQPRKGVGASLNNGLVMCNNRLVLHAVDDWNLLDSLDLSPWADILESDENICGFRFFPHPDLIGRIKYINPGVYAMDLDKHHFAFATRPSLWHPRMFETYGMFEEGVSAYEVERLYNEKYCLIVGPKLWLALPDQWAHLGGVELGDITP